MADAGDAGPLLGAGGGHERAGGGKEDPVPDPCLHGLENVGPQYRGAAPAAGASGVDILGAQVVDEHAAVHIARPQPDPVLVKERLENIVPDGPQIPGENGVD